MKKKKEKKKKREKTNSEVRRGSMRWLLGCVIDQNQRVRMLRRSDGHEHVTRIKGGRLMHATGAPLDIVHPYLYSMCATYILLLLLLLLLLPVLPVTINV